ncbi:MAG: SHOCT domain-containing protein [Verrucomicrobiota bacterium]
MDVLFTVLTAMMTGFVIGSAARFAVPGPDPMPFWLTVVIGLCGSAIGTAIAAAMFGAGHTFDSPGRSFVTLLLAIGFATALVVAYRVFVQKRPITGPEARHFPRRGFGVAKMRERLRLLGIDPDRVHTDDRVLREPAPERTHEDVVDQLEKLRDLRDHGTITEEEYERARDRLRRY